MYRYEPHMHTMEASACAHSGGAEMAEKYKAAGYTGIIVTDHFFNGNSAVPRNLPWSERIELFCSGYEHALARGREIGLDVFFGFEYGDGGSDFLIYGLDKEWLLKNDFILEMELTRFLEYARSCGGMAVQAHPFRDYEYIRSTTHAPHFVDAVETVNMSNKPEFNERAKIYAGWYGLPGTGGSDSHDTSSRWYAGGVLSERKFDSALDYARAAAAGEITVIEQDCNAEGLKL